MMFLKRLIKLQPASIERWLFSILIVLLPTQLGKHFWPDWSYVFSLRIDYLAITIYLWDIMVVVLWLVFCFRKPKINWWALGVMVGFFILQSVSLFFSTNWQVGISRMANWIPAGLFGVYIASRPPLVIREALLKYLPITIIGSSFLAVMQVITGSSVGWWIFGERSFSLSTSSIATFNWYGSVFLRPYATFSHPNVFAAFMLLCGVLLLFLKGVTSRYMVLNQILVGLSVLLSFSRASLVVLIAFSLFLLRKQLIVLILLFLVLSPILFVRFDSAFNFDQQSLVRREELAETAWKMAKENPWFGVGLNNFIPSAMSAVFLSGTNRFLQPVHNIFLLVLVESGVVGLVGFLTLFLFPVFFYSPTNILSRSQILGLLLIIVFLGMVDHYFLTLPQGQRMFFLLWGLFFCRK